jgi:hypothetical protein
MANNIKSASRKSAVRKATGRRAAHQTRRAKKSSSVLLGQIAAAAPRPGSKLAKVIELLYRKEGVNVAELTSTTKWLPHTARAALTGLRKRGFHIERFHGEGKTSHYRISAMKSVSAKA